VGDGANDLDMMALSGLSIAFNAKPVVQAAAKAAITDGNLENVLFLMGITQEEIDSTGL
jgi:phosphoserine phosphatase